MYVRLMKSKKQLSKEIANDLWNEYSIVPFWMFYCGIRITLWFVKLKPKDI
ncbi:MAG: hypothetical protein ACOCVF_02880 [bacterium]